MTKRGPRGPRNKIKQMLVVEGHPSQLFKKGTASVYYLSYSNKKEKLGRIGNKAINLLRSIPGVEVTEEKEDHERPIDLPHVQSFRKMGNNTIIVVAAPTEELLRDRLITVNTKLSNRGVCATERCQWVCAIDKGKPSEEPVKEKTKSLREMVIKMGVGAND